MDIKSLLDETLLLRSDNYSVEHFETGPGKKKAIP